MKIEQYASKIIDWSAIPKEQFPGETGMTTWQTQMMNDIRVRMVQFSPGYKADHLCNKGHVIFCLEGELEVGLPNGSQLILSQGMTYLIGDDTEPHLALSENGCKLFIVD